MRGQKYRVEGVSVRASVFLKREEKNKRIWDLREKRHKGVEKGDKAFLEPTRRSGHGAW